MKTKTIDNIILSVIFGLLIIILLLIYIPDQRTRIYLRQYAEFPDDVKYDYNIVNNELHVILPEIIIVSY